MKPGLKKGQSGKNTSLINAFCNYLIEGGFERFKKELDNLNSKEFVILFLKLAKMTNHSPSTEIDAVIKIINYLKIKSKENGK
jgi:hypothetical protein